jgi:hypothetical protein
MKIENKRTSILTLIIRLILLIASLGSSGCTGSTEYDKGAASE